MRARLVIIAVLAALAATVGGVLPGAAPAAAHGSPAADVSEADRAAIVAVIRDQMAAFRRDDGPGAYAHASPVIQALFPTPEIFMAMVRDGYSAVYRPRQVEFLDLVEIGGEPVQRVYVVGPDGRALLALYTMERQADGSWRIAGRVLVDAPGSSA